MTPFIHFESFPDRTAAIIAAQIQPNLHTKDGSLASLNLTEQRSEYIRQINEHVQSLFKNFALTSIALRYIYVPSTEEQGSQFVIACLLRSDGEDKEQATQRIYHAWNEYVSAFPHVLYSLSPIADKQVFATIYQPIDPNIAEIVEIRKLEDVVPTKYLAAGEYYYSIKPINSSYTPIEDTLKFINQQKAPFVLNICFWPSCLEEEEEYAIRQVTGELYKFATGFSVRLYGGQTIFEPDINAEICYKRYASLIENAESLAQFRVQIISSRKISDQLVTPIARTLFHDYELEYVSDENHAEATWTYLFLDPRPIWGGGFVWDTESPPNSLRRVAYLANPKETLKLFRLPIPFHERKSDTTIVFAERIEHVGDKNFTVHGNIVNSSIVANIDNMFGEIEQTLKASSSINQADMRYILSLLEEMRDILQKVPSEKATDAEVVAKRAQKLSEELTAKKPDKDDLEHHGRLLIKAAENLKQVMPSVLEIAGRIVKFILTFAL